MNKINRPIILMGLVGGNMEECKHDRVYDNAHLLMSYPPQIRWICRKCGAEGTEVAGPPTTFADEYSAIKEKFTSGNKEV